MPEVYVLPTELASLSGLASDDTRLILACVTATHWVAARVGEAVAPVVADEAMEALTRAECDVRWTAAARIAALRFLRSPDAAFGILGGMGDLAMRVAQDIPEAKLALQGARTSPDAWGIG